MATNLETLEFVEKEAQLSWRLYIILSGVALVILAMIGYGYFTSMRMVTNYTPLVDATMEVRLSLTTAHLWLEEIMSGEDKDVNEWVYANVDDAAWYTDAMLNGGESEEGKYIALDDSDLRQVLLQVQQDIDMFRRIIGERYAALESTGSDNELDEEFNSIFSQMNRDLDDLENKMQQLVESATDSFQIMQMILVLVVVVAFVVAGGVLYRFDLRRIEYVSQLQSLVDDLRESMKSVVAKEYLEGKLNQYQAFVGRVRNGDLTQRLELSQNGATQDDATDDLNQLGTDLNNMVEGLSIMAGQIRETVGAVTSAASEIQAATTQQTASATEQNATVTQTVATVEEVRQTVMQTAERARTVADNASKSIQISQQGQRAVNSTIKGMNIIRERVESIAENILMLSEKTQQIGEIINTVNNLADQSKLLALNASIEAARAGEEGKGFAVVAMEVRQLAEQSRDATARVQNILNEIQQATNSAVMVTEEGSKGAEQGMSLVEQAGLAIRDLASTIEEAAQAAGQIAASTQQQTNGMDQLAIAMNQIEQATAQATATTQQTETSVHDLLDMAHQLEAAAARYQL